MINKSSRTGGIVVFKGVEGVGDLEMCFVRIKAHAEEFGRDGLVG